MPKDMPDAYLADDAQNFHGLFFIGGHIDGLAVAISKICGVSRIFKDDQAAILNQAKEAYSIAVWNYKSLWPDIESQHEPGLNDNERWFRPALSETGPELNDTGLES